MREHGVTDHHDLLPWCGVTSLSRDSGVTEGQVRMLTSWVERGRQTTEYRHGGPDHHHHTTYLADGDVEIAVLTDQEYAMATTPRPSSRVRLGPQPTPTAPAPAPVAPPIAPVTTPEPRRSGRVVLRRPPVEAAPEPIEAAPEPVVVVSAAPSLPDLTGAGYVGPNPRMGLGLGWRPPEPPRTLRVGIGRRAHRAYRGRDDGPEPHGPPCPLELHPVGVHAWWHVPEVRA
jgi:hypothetical protein